MGKKIKEVRIGVKPKEEKPKLKVKKDKNAQ